ncbi:MAG: glycoside hydrolase family 2 TIM barrel-domain containing protein [Rhodothermales bacterium]
MFSIRLLLAGITFLFAGAALAQTTIPLPEHPRPDFERPQWLNLNGSWSFRFDAEDAGLADGWHTGGVAFPLTINVPFPWGSNLSGVPDGADIGWYARDLTAPADWAGQRVFLVIGAADYHTTIWLDGHQVGEHEGGYTPFSAELTAHLRPGSAQRLVVRVDDVRRDHQLYGKQGYGNARGIWQTPYLEVRGRTPAEFVHFAPDIDRDRVTATVRLLEPASSPVAVVVDFTDPSVPDAQFSVPAGAREASLVIPIPHPHRWSLDDPHLYDVDVRVGEGDQADRVRTYFGMRKISVMDMPGTDYRYVALNDEPVYLQLALDQAYHPDGFYTFPSDDFIRDEVLRSRQIGLNGMRVHVKVALPRKLYWADRLGVLIMADLPNSWGEPVDIQKQEVERSLEWMMQRDFNHPSIFAWVPFNETWGLFTKAGDREIYTPETQAWVASVYDQAKRRDPTRLVEDNSVCCHRGHTRTDINSWHSYLPGWAWVDSLAAVSKGTYPGSTWNFEPGYRQDRQPNINSEFGNVWGYEGSTGDVDWTWDYHRAIDAFRRFPRVAGWLYTEHHDVINEWNGYWRFDRSEKITGLDAFVDGMSLRDFHAPIYVAPETPLSQDAAAGARVEVPLVASFMTGRDYGEELVLRSRWFAWDALGNEVPLGEQTRRFAYRPWMQGSIGSVAGTMPAGPAVVVLALTVEDAAGAVLGRNFSTFVVSGAPPQTMTVDGRRTRLLRVAAKDLAESDWSVKQWDVLDGLKVNGAGAGHFSYRLAWPADLKPTDVEGATFLVEASAKQLFGKDRDNAAAMSGDYMLGGGTFDPSRNPNAYPMTDTQRYPSSVRVLVNDVPAGVYELPDDPADSRGVLSWHNQLKDRKLREAGSYGYRLAVTIPPDALAKAAEEGAVRIRLEVDDALPGGLAIYGARFGRYPLDPTVALTLK